MSNYNNYYRGRKVLVTGGLGFIGLNICTRLLELGAEVTVLDNFMPIEASKPLSEMLSHIKVAIADIRDEANVERIVRDQEIIFNLAGKSGAADSNKTPINDLDINCRGHLTILEACRTFNPEVTIVFPSSRLVYGKPLYLPVDEKHPLNPESIYAAHKLAVENYHLIYGKLYGLKATVLRISNPFGPNQVGDKRVYGVINSLISTAATGGVITLFGEGKQTRDYLYICDLVEAFLLAACKEDARGKIYNIGNSNSTSIRELADLAVAISGSGNIISVPWPQEYLAIETGDYLSNISLAQKELGWSPQTALNDGLAKTMAFYKS